jgi:hypothetical protein
MVLATVLLGVLAKAQTPPANPPVSPGPDVVASSGNLSMPLLRQRCIEFTAVKRGDKPDDLRDCRVSEFGDFGMVDGMRYYYALYCLVPNYAPDKGRCDDGSFPAGYFRNRGLGIFISDESGADVRLLLQRATAELLMIYSPPRVVRNAAGTILYLPIAVDGTSNFNESEYYLRETSEWRAIEAREWLTNLVARVPSGLQIETGVWPNLETMEAEAGLWRPADAHCCPTGGTARVKLSIRSRHFVLDSVVFEKPR